MKLLLDENLSRRIVPFLQADFPGTSQVALEGLERLFQTEGCRVVFWQDPEREFEETLSSPDLAGVNLLRLDEHSPPGAQRAARTGGADRPLSALCAS